MGLANDDDPIFFYHKMPQSSRGRAFDGVVTPSVRGILTGWVERSDWLKNKLMRSQDVINLISILNPEKSRKLYFRCSPVKAKVFQIHASCTI